MSSKVVFFFVAKDKEFQLNVEVVMNMFQIFFLFLALRPSSQFMKGVNYGNRFIPEDWMTGDDHEDVDVPNNITGSGESIYGDHYGEAVMKPDDVARVSLCDVDDDRILSWLEDMIQEQDFIKMSEYGVKLLRLPTGYWNWVDLGDATPNAPDDVAARFRKLQSVSPAQYEPHLDKIFQLASQYNIKLLPELHGAPGSQNGEFINLVVFQGARCAPSNLIYCGSETVLLQNIF